MDKGIISSFVSTPRTATAAKPANAARKPAARRIVPEPRPVRTSPVPMEPEQQRVLTEKIAYSLAEKRGFAPGQELDDWLTAEAEVRLLLEGESFSGD
jgi:hypothetical protein